MSYLDQNLRGLPTIPLFKIENVHMMTSDLISMLEKEAIKHMKKMAIIIDKTVNKSIDSKAFIVIISYNYAKDEISIMLELPLEFVIIINLIKHQNDYKSSSMIVQEKGRNSRVVNNFNDLTYFLVDLQNKIYSQSSFINVNKFRDNIRLIYKSLTLNNQSLEYQNKFKLANLSLNPMKNRTTLYQKEVSGESLNIIFNDLYYNMVNIGYQPNDSISELSSKTRNYLSNNIYTIPKQYLDDVYKIMVNLVLR